MTPNNNIHKRGFTLVELAVVIVIIGLIIGAVIKGQELVNGARLNAVENQVNAIKSAFTTFQDRYNALPGDFAQAQARLPGCQDAGANCTNGDGDGIVDIDSNGLLAAPGVESRMAWQHLAFANLITGIVPGAPSGESQYGQNFPSARTSGGFVLLQTKVGTPALSGLWLRLQGTAPNQPVSTGNTGGALTPGQAAEIDRKLDDGKPLTGYVRAGGNVDDCAPTTGLYNEAATQRDCMLYFFIQ